MARYILIDTHSGYIFADTADLAGWEDGMSPEDAARLLDTSMKEPEHTYVESEPHDASATYDVYRADIDGSEAVPVVWDGQDKETIEAVKRECRFETFLRRIDAE